MQPVKYDEKSKPARVIIEEHVLTEDYCRSNIVSKHEEKTQKKLASNTSL